VVGINTAIVATGQGIGFAIPVNMAKDIVAQLKDKGEVTRGWLGVGIQNLTPELADYYKVEDGEGVLVTHVFEGDPADEAGIKVNDIIVSVNGKKVSTSRELSRTIAGIGVNKKATIVVLRDGKEMTFSVKTAKREDEKTMVQEEPKQDSELGLTVRPIDPEIASRFGYDETEKGLFVTGVKSGSKAEEAGIQQGDLIKEVNRRPVENISDFRDELDKTKSGETIRLLLKRGQSGFIAIKMTK
jgi:serine protease Do